MLVALALVVVTTGIAQGVGGPTLWGGAAVNPTQTNTFTAVVTTTALAQNGVAISSSTTRAAQNASASSSCQNCPTLSSPFYSIFGAGPAKSPQTNPVLTFSPLILALATGMLAYVALSRVQRRE